VYIKLLRFGNERSGERALLYKETSRSGLTVFQQHVNRLGSAALLTEADQQKICLVT
jgi:hypothetical protein